MSDRVTVMDQGCIVQSGTPMEIYQAPQERFVANFIGLTNFVEGRVHSMGGGQNQFGEVETASGRLRCVLPDDIASGDSVVLLIRPEDINVAFDSSFHRENVLHGQVDALIFMRDALDCQLVVGGQRLRTKLHPSSGIQRGQTVSLHLPAGRCRALRSS